MYCMRQALEEAMEAQRQTFQVELEKVTGELEKVKLRSTALKKEIETSEAKKSAQKQNYTREKLVAKEVATAKNSRPEEMVEIRDSQSTKSSQADMDTIYTQSSLGTNARISQPIETHKVNSSPPGQPRQCQSGVLRQSSTQIIKKNPTRSLMEKSWIEVKYVNKRMQQPRREYRNKSQTEERFLSPEKKYSQKPFISLNIQPIKNLPLDITRSPLKPQVIRLLHLVNCTKPESDVKLNLPRA